MPGVLTLKVLIVGHNGRQAPASTACHATITAIHRLRQEAKMSTHPVKLIVCIALGVWLGLVATAATGIFAYTTFVAGKVNAVSAAIGHMTPHKPRAESTESDPDSSAMFEKYKQNLLDSQAQQNQEITQAEREKRLSAPKCQFWMQQDQTAPSEKTRTNVSQFCG